MFSVHFTSVSLLLLSLKLDTSESETIDQQPPSFVESPSKIRFFNVGDDVILKCNATGHPEVTYFWKKNGVKISASSKHRLEISSASLANDGLYQCFAENKHGTAFTNVTQLRMSTIQANGPTRVTSHVNTTEGRPFRIPGSSFKAIPDSKSYGDFVWTKGGGESVILGKRIQVADNGDLHFAYAMTADDLEGKHYTNSLTNSFSNQTVEGNFTRVNVKTHDNATQEFPPSLAFASVSRSIALEGESVSLRCFFSGKPEPSVTWLRSVDSLPADRFVQSNFDTELTLVDLAKSDETLYHCMGTNAHGSLLHNLTFQVQASPRFVEATDGPQDMYVIEKDTAVFRCNATATPEATVEWFYNANSLKEMPRDRFVISGDGKSLTVSSVCRECKGQGGQNISDTGVIQCNASNVHGYALGSGFLNVITLKQAASLNAAAKERSSVTFDFAFIVISAIVVSVSF